MSEMRLALAAALCLAAHTHAAPAPPPRPGKDGIQKKLIGKWEVAKGNGAPPGATVEFTKDGKVLFAFVKDGKEVKVDATYKVEGKGFSMTLKRGDKEGTQKIEVVKAENDKLVLRGERGDELELRRKRPSKR